MGCLGAHGVLQVPQPKELHECLWPELPERAGVAMLPERTENRESIRTTLVESHLGHRGVFELEETRSSKMWLQFSHLKSNMGMSNLHRTAC